MFGGDQVKMNDSAIHAGPGASPKNDSRTKASSTPRQVRRRNRLITSCLECRRRKLKCDKLHPCTNCNRFSRECMFLAPTLDSISQQKLNEIKDKMGSLERTLEEDVVRQDPQKSQYSQYRKTSMDLPGEANSSDSDGPVPEDVKFLEPSPLAFPDGSYEDDATDDMLDLGIRVGKMRMTERVGGLFRPKMSEELSAALLNPKYDHRTEEEKAAGVPQILDDGNDFLEPGPTYIAPGSGFIFGDVGSRRDLIHFLPTKDVGDALVNIYHQNVHLLARAVHWPSLQFQYQKFWGIILAGMEPPASQQALILSVMFSAVASMPDSDAIALFARPKATIQSQFRQGVEVALSKAQFLRTTKIETIQALIIYLIPMCRDQMSRAHSVLVGTAIRLGQCMGLHRDPADVYGLPPLECHIRRILWFQLCFLDFRTAEVQGPRPCIQREDYDTRFPGNIDDLDLASGKTEESSTRFTDMTLSRMRFECNEMYRIIWYDRLRLEQKKVSLLHVLGKIESFRKAMQAKYDAILDPTVPIQHYAQLCLKVSLSRMHIMILHRYVRNLGGELPERFRQIINSGGAVQLEAACALDTTPTFERWRWYNAVHQQWHTALLLLLEVFENPHRREADRIWKAIDYVFEPDLSSSRAQKARSILSALRDRTAVYRDIRRTRTPMSIRTEDVHRVYRLAVANKQTSQSQPPASNITVPTGQMTTHAIREKNPGLGNGERVNDKKADKRLDANESWNFGNKLQTFLVDGVYPANHPTNPSGQVPGWAIKQQRTYDVSIFQNHAAATPHMDFSSPSESSTIQESWPPFISNSQVQWQPVQHVSPAPVQQASPSCTDTSLSQAGSSRRHPSQPFAPPNMVFVPTDTPPQDEPIMSDIDWNEWDKLFPPEEKAVMMDSLSPQHYNNGLQVNARPSII